MLRLKLIEKNSIGLVFEPVNENGESRDFWQEGISEGSLKLYNLLPIAAAFFEEGKEYEVVIHEKHPNITPLVSPA